MYYRRDSDRAKWRSQATEEPAGPAVPRSGGPYPKAGDKVKYLTEGKWQRVEVTSRGGSVRTDG